MMFTPSRAKSTPNSIEPRSTRKFLSTPNVITPKRTPISLSGRRSHLLRHSDAYISPSAAVGTPYKTENYVAKPSGSLPVLIQEAISVTDANDVSAYFSNNGWAWIICDTKLFLWKFQQIASKQLCKEVHLSSDGVGYYNAQLTWVGHSSGANDDGFISMVVAKSSGHIKFWPNVIQSMTFSSKISADSYGFQADDELLQVLALKVNSYLLVTRNGAMYHFSVMGESITCTRLHSSHGLLAGIGRRVSSIFYAPGDVSNVMGIVLLKALSRSSSDVALLTATKLQRWRISGGNNQLISEFGIEELLNEPITKAICKAYQKDLKIWPIDITLYSEHDRVAVLVAIEDLHEDNTRISKLCICICPLSVLADGQNASPHPPQIVAIPLDHEEIAVGQNHSEVLDYRLLIPNATYAVVWKQNRIIIKSLEKLAESYEDCLPLGPTNVVLGVGDWNNRVLVVEATAGLLYIDHIRPNADIVREAGESLLQSPAVRTHTPLSKLSESSIVSGSKGLQIDASTHNARQLQAALIHFNRMDVSRARGIIDEAFGQPSGKKALNDAVIFVSRELIDDYPALDPRWAESLPQDSSNASSSSLILQHQIKDKQKAHQLFVDFLLEVGVWDTLSLSSGDKAGRKTCTQWTLLEHREKLVAAAALREKHADYQDVVDSAIRKVLEKRGSFSDKSGLTPQDVFYREISRIQDIFECLLDLENATIANSSLSPRELLTTISGVNEIFEGMLTAAHGYRNSRGLLHTGKEIEFCPWTSSSGRHSVGETLLSQHETIFTHGLAEVNDGQQRALLHMQAVTLADLILAEYEQQLESLQDDASFTARYDEVMESFARHRNAVIVRILDAGLTKKAASLAEKYHDFNILLEICDKNSDQNMLSQYMAEYKDMGFADSLFSWFLERGKFRELLQYTTSKTTLSPENGAKLYEFLSSHPKINWLHCIKIGDLMSAQKTLQYLAEMEAHSNMKKNHYISLSKLAAAFSDAPNSEIEDTLDDLNSLQTLVKYQDMLPNAVLDKLGFSLENMPVFSVEKLIELYVGDVNDNSNEVDFMKALDLLNFLPQGIENSSESDSMGNRESVKELKAYIWSRAILKDNWRDIKPGTDAVKASSHTVLAKTLALACESGVLTDCLPDPESLMEEEALASIKSDKSLQYLIRINFEEYERLVMPS